MIIAKAEMTELLHLGAREWETHPAESIPPPSGNSCVLVWWDAVDLLPDSIVVAKGHVQDFLAWTTTYVPHLTPITALVDLVEYGRPTENLGGRSRQTSRKAKTDDVFLRGCLGLIHAEVVGAIQGTFAPAHVGLTPYVSTFSWLAFQLELGQMAEVDLTEARENWEEARRLLDARRLMYASEDVEEVWWFAGELGRAPKNRSRKAEQVVEFVRSVWAGMPAVDVLDVEKESLSLVESLRSGTLESRIEVFRRLAQSLYEKRSPPAAHAVLLGFALSLISQGSFSHVSMLGPLRVTDVRPLLWYGWFDFCRQNPEAASPPAAATSLQLRRAVSGQGSGWLRRHIALEELRVLARQKDAIADCLLDIRHPVGVEIMRGGVAMIQPGQMRGSESVRGRQQRLPFED